MSENELTVLLNQIKDHWPEFQITKENLLRPTRDLVVRFYTNFINEYNEKIGYLTRCQASDAFDGSDLTSEERLFQQLSRLLVRLHSLTITLLDIYQPTQKGTKNFFTVCVHFITFIDYLVNEIDLLGNDIFKIKEETNKFLVDIQELLNEISENAKTKVEIMEFNKNLLENEYKSVKQAYKEMVDLRAAKEKQHAELRSQIESAKWELQNEEYEVNCLEAKKKDLLEQKITHSEYQNILQRLETLKSDSEGLNSLDVNMEDGLVHENEDLTHFTDCNRMLSKLDFNVHYVKELVEKEKDLKEILHTTEILQSHMLTAKQQKLENENKLTIKENLANLQFQYKKFKTHYANSLEQFSQELAVVMKDIEEKLQNANQTVSNYNEDIIRLEGDMEKLRKTFMTEYVRISKVEKRVVNKFKETLMKFGNSDNSYNVEENSLF